MIGKILEEFRCSTNQTGGSTPELANKDNHPRSGEQLFYPPGIRIK